MKKIISFVLTVLCLAALVCPITASAGEIITTTDGKDLTITVADDFESIMVYTEDTPDGSRYVIFDGEDCCGFNTTDVFGATTELPENVKYCQITAKALSYYTVVEAFEISYALENGTRLTYYYLHEDLLDNFNRLINEGKVKVKVYGTPNSKTTLDKLMGESVVLSGSDLKYAESFCVYSNDEYSVYYGDIIYYNEKIYFASTDENNGDIYLWRNDYLNAHKIKDATVESEIRAQIQLYYEDDYGYMDDIGFVNKISAFFLLFVFAFIPFCVMVLSLVFIIDKNSRYKTVYAFVLTVSASLLAVVSILASIFINSK